MDNISKFVTIIVKNVLSERVASKLKTVHMPIKMIATKFINILYLKAIILIIFLSKEDSNSIVYMTIEGSGNQPILCNDFNYNPDAIYVNSFLQTNSNTKTVDLNKQTNNIVIIFNQRISNCSSMFKDLTNIKSIDLSKFDSSSVNEMFYMFHGCTSLISLNLDNFDTSKVSNMRALFYKCNSLISLNLSSFVTSNVINMNDMFQGCN